MHCLHGVATQSKQICDQLGGINLSVEERCLNACFSIMLYIAVKLCLIRMLFSIKKRTQAGMVQIYECFLLFHVRLKDTVKPEARYTLFRQQGKERNMFCP